MTAAEQTNPPPLSVIIPSYNEAAGIGDTLRELLTYPGLEEAEVIVVNDASTDDTAEIVAQFPRVRLLSHPVNRGYNSALQTGMRGAKGRYLIWYDSDGQHRPEDLMKIYRALVDDDLQYCIGVRGADSHEVNSRRFGKRILRWTVQIIAGRAVPDFNSGLRGFQRDVILQYLHLFPRGFGASTLTTLIMIERHHYGTTVPITVRERVGVSQVKALRDGIRTLMIVLRMLLLFKPLVFFGSISLLLILSGSIYGFAEAISLREGFPVFGALVIILGVQTLFFGLINDQVSQMRREKFRD